jgi:dTDP-4-dehydrorhamnose reductase
VTKTIQHRLRILIVGGDGTIGHELAQYLAAEGHEVVATTRRRDRVSATSIFLDMAEAHGRLPQVDVAVICAAMTSFSDCRNRPELARQINVTAPVALCEQLALFGTRVVLLSTSAVFDCLTPLMKATERPTPRSIYGRLKTEAEEGALAFGDTVTVLRLTKIVRRGAGVLNRWINELKNGQTVSAFEDHGLSPISLGDAVDAIGALIERGASGIYQVSGAADITFEEAARHLAVRIGVPSQRVVGVKAVDHGVPIDEITPCTSLDTSRLSALTGYVPPLPRNVIDTVFAPSFAAARLP